MFYKEFGLSENWQIINFLQNVNANFDFFDNSNPLNLDGLFIRQGSGINAFFDNIQLQTISEVNNFDVCVGDSVNVGYDLDGIDFLWNDNSTNSNNFLSEVQTHTVELNFNNFIFITNTFNLNFIDLGNSDLGQDFSICPSDSQLITLENILNVSYNWHDNSNLNNFLIIDTGLVSVELNHLGCISYDSLFVSHKIVPTLDLGSDTTICEFEVNYVLTPETDGTSFNWQDGTNTELYTVTEEGLYTLEVFLEGCSSSDSIYIRTKKEIKLGNDTTICENQPLFLIVDSIYDDYSWFDGFKEDIKIANYKSSQWLNVTIDGCKMYPDTININVDLLPRLKLAFEDTLVCDDKEIELSVTGTDYESVRWHNFSVDTTTTIVGEGNYWVILSNYCGFVTDTVNVKTENCNCKAFIPNSFSPNKDLLNDYYQYQFNCEVFRFDHKIFDKWGTLIFQSKNQNDKWDGTCNGEKCPTGVYVSRFEFFYKNSIQKNIITRRISLYQ